MQMMLPTPYIHLPEVVDREALREWQNSLGQKTLDNNCPKELVQFINAVADALPQFTRYAQYNSAITGRELILSGITEMNGERIISSVLYQLPVPMMKATDHKGAMVRIWNKKGRKGLEQYLRAHCNPKEVDKLLRVMKNEVFKEDAVLL